MKSYSQSGQDLFVHAILPKTNGTFLEIGCSHPFDLSNTYALEQLGWNGIMLDNDANAVDLCRQNRKSTVILGDATKIDWSRLLFDETVDYLSLDVDGATLDALRQLPLGRVRFNVITIEHDAYRFGDGPRQEMRRILKDAGYDLVCADVCSTDGSEFEDWYVSPDYSATAERFRCEKTKWPDIIARI